MKKGIGIIMIVIGSVWEILTLWGITIGANIIGAVVLLILGFLLLFFGVKLTKAG